MKSYSKLMGILLAVFLCVNTAYAWSPFSNEKKEAEKLLSSAESMIIVNNHNEARKNIESAILKIRENEKVAKDSPEIYKEAGRLYITIGDYKTANNIFDIARKLGSKTVNQEIDEICNNHAIQTLTEVKNGLANRSDEQTHTMIGNAIVLNQQNPSALLEAGKIYTTMGWYTQTDNVFNTALQHGDENIKLEISKVFRARAIVAVNEGNINGAVKLFTRVHQINASSKEDDVNNLIVEGIDAVSRGKTLLANYYLDTAYQINPAQNGEKISKLLFEKGSQGYTNVCLAIFQLAVKYSDTYKPKIAQIMFDLYNSAAVSDGDKKKIKTVLADFLSKAEYMSLFPTIHERIFSEGPHVLDIPQGATSNYWIVFPKDKNYKFSIKSDDEKYIMYFDSGEVVTGWGPEPIPNKKRFKFRVKNISGKPINLVVK